MYQLIKKFPHSIMESIRMLNTMNIETRDDEITNVMVCGVGISGVAANLVEAFLLDELMVPYKVNKGYRIPAYVDRHTLFIVNSFTGNTIETNEQIQRAVKKGARIICIGSGGEMEKIARTHFLDFVKIPGESVTNRRMSIAYMIVLQMGVLAHFELINNSFITHLLAAYQLLEAKSTQMELQAKEIVTSIKGCPLVIYSGYKLEASVLRAQHQINENAKQLCHINFFPEMNHNEIVGWAGDTTLQAKTAVIIVRSSLEHERTSSRIEICKPIFKKQAQNVLEIKAIGKNFIEQSFYLIHLFDWISYYLALANGTDPLQIDIINHIKSELSLREAGSADS